MLKKRVIPIVLLDGFSVLKTIQFSQRRNLGSPVTVLKTYNTRNVDELILLDIDASKQSRAIDKFTIEEIAQECFMPLTVGGGIRSLQDIEQLLKKGADKIAVNTFAIEQPKFITEASRVFGSQCITVSVDVVEVDNKYYQYSNGAIHEDVDIEDWIKEIEFLGAGEILLNNVTRDGTMGGGSYELSSLADSVKIPLIYAGGISSPDDAAKIASTSVSGVGVSSIFHFTDYTPENCRSAIKKLGLPAR